MLTKYIYVQTDEQLLLDGVRSMNTPLVRENLLDNLAYDGNASEHSNIFIVQERVTGTGREDFSFFFTTFNENKFKMSPVVAADDLRKELLRFVCVFVFVLLSSVCSL